MKLKRLLEDIIAKDKIQIKIDYGVDRTKHAGERQDRHVGERGGTRITNQEMSNAVKKAIPKLTTAMLKDRIDINKDKVQVTDGEINLVGILTPGGGGINSFNFKIITTMRKKDFRPNSDTKMVIKV